MAFFAAKKNIARYGKRNSPKQGNMTYLNQYLWNENEFLHFAFIFQFNSISY